MCIGLKRCDLLETSVPFSLKPRNSRIELLRIVAMFLIVLSHACVHGGFSLEYVHVGTNRLFLQCSPLGNLGVDIFVIISGYFLCRKKSPYHKLSKLLPQVWFYSIGIYLVCRFCFGISYAPRDLVRVFLPGVFSEYWFFTVYTTLLFLIPALNIFLNAASRVQLRKFLLWMTVLWVLLPALTGEKWCSTELTQFILLYLLGAYMRRFPDNRFHNRSVQVGITAVCGLLLLLSNPVLDLFVPRFPWLSGHGTDFFSRNSPLVLGCALGLFSLAVYSRPFVSPLINAVAGCSFGIYLIHDNPAIRGILWTRLLPNVHHTGSRSLPLRMLGSTALVCAICVGIEWLRQKTVSAPLEAAFHTLYARVRSTVSALLQHRQDPAVK